MIWDLQRAYYERRASEAFAEVPHQVVDNPFVAAAYARVVLGFLRDGARGRLDPSEPLYVGSWAPAPGASRTASYASWARGWTPSRSDCRRSSM